MRIIFTNLQTNIAAAIHHKATTDGIIGLSTQAMTGRIERLAGRATGVFRKRFPAVVNQVGFFPEANDMLPERLFAHDI